MSYFLSIPAAHLTGALPAISGAALTSLTSGNLVGALPAISGAALTALTSSALSGALPAISGAALTSLTAANITGTNTLPAGVLPTTVPLTGATNTFTAQQIFDQNSNSLVGSLFAGNLSTGASAGIGMGLQLTDALSVTSNDGGMYLVKNGTYDGTGANRSSKIIFRNTQANVGVQSGSLDGLGNFTCTTFTGSGSGLTALPSSQLTGALPAISGAALTALSSSALSGALPAISGAALTALSSSALSGALPAISGAALTGLTSGQITTALGYTPVNNGGGTMTGLLVLSADPTAPLGAVSKQYVDAAVANLSVRTSVIAAQLTPLAANVYANGASGVGATLTASANAALVIDGVTLTVGQRVLIAGEATAANNGVYTVTQTGSGAAPYILTRATDSNGLVVDSVQNLAFGLFVFVTSGTTNTATGWTLIGSGTLTVGTTALNWTQFSGTGDILPGTFMSKVGNTLNNTGVGTFNTRSGAVVLTSGDVTTALTYTPLNNTGGTMTGNIIFATGTNQAVIDMRITGDTVDRLQVNTDGSFHWGTGAAAADTTLSRTGVNTLTASGTFIATTFSGSGASLTALPSSQLTGALPAISGAALTGFTSGQITTALGFTPSAANIDPARVALTTPVTITTADNTVFTKLSSAGPVAVSLPASPATGLNFTIKDAKGDATTNNITITPAAGTIDGAATLVLNINYSSVTLEYNGTEWSII